VTAGLEGVYGLRLLAKPGVQRVVLGFLAVVILAWRVVQFAGWTAQPVWAYDFHFYWLAAGQLLHGQPMYSATQLAGPYVPQAQEGFLYPPPMAALVTPLATLFPSDYRAANWVWAAIGATILVVSVLGLVRVLELGRRYPILAGRGRWWAVVAAFAFPPVIDELVVGNVHLLLLGLLTLAWLALASPPWPARSQPSRTPLPGLATVIAGLAVGAAALVKVFPGVLVAWFLVTRRLGAIAWTIVAIVVLSLIALPLTGLQTWREYPTVLGNLSSTPEAVDALAPTMWLAPAIGFTIARVVVTVIGLGVVWLVRRADVRLGFAAAVVAAVLITPAMYTSYLTIFVLPLLLGLAAGVRLRWLGLAYLLMWGGQQPALGDLAWVVNRGFPTLGALVLLATLVARATERVPSMPTAAAEQSLSRRALAKEAGVEREVLQPESEDQRR
jgi:hypothetical protein